MPGSLVQSRMICRNAPYVIRTGVGISRGPLPGCHWTLPFGGTAAVMTRTAISSS